MSYNSNASSPSPSRRMKNLSGCSLSLGCISKRKSDSAPPLLKTTHPKSHYSVDGITASQRENPKVTSACAASTAELRIPESYSLLHWQQCRSRHSRTSMLLRCGPARDSRYSKSRLPPDSLKCSSNSPANGHCRPCKLRHWPAHNLSALARCPCPYKNIWGPA